MLYAARKQHVAGLDLTAVTMDQALRLVATTNAGTPGRSIHLVNSYSAVLADRDRGYAEALADDRAVLLPDGTPLVWLSRLASRSEIAGVRGPTLMRRALLDGDVEGKRHYLLGSTEENLSRLAEKLESQGRGGALCGYYSPPFGPIDEDEWERIVTKINDADADIVWVGLGTPLQDFIAVRLAKESKASVVAVGAAFDFLAGTKKEAPRWLHGTGLEWVHRLLTEPRRLWRRYLVGNLQFLGLALREHLRVRRERH